MRLHRARFCVRTLIVCITLLGVTACGITSGSTTGAGAPSTATNASLNPQAAFTVTAVDLAVNPYTIAGRTCGSYANFVYKATFHIPAHTAGGTIQFMYTTNNGRSSTNASVRVPAGATTAIYTFTKSGTLPLDHTFPGVAEVVVTSPNGVHSPQVTVAGSCASGAFKVTSIDMAVHPTTITGIVCGTTLSVTWTATFHLAANSPGGTIQLSYTWNEGRGSTNAQVTVPPRATIATFAFTHTDKVEPDHSFPQYGSVLVTSPNLLRSPQITPTGNCTAY
jgi:hypothetical protein